MQDTHSADSLLAHWSQPRSTLRAAMWGSVLCFLAFPPLGWSWLIWIAPAPWLLLVRMPQLPGRRPYVAFYLAGIVYWILVVHWIRKPHPLNYLGLLALAGYLGIYLPIFAALVRTAVHRLKLPLALAAPVVWTGLDWVRAHLMTGFLMGSLSHTLYRTPTMIQIADLVGEYGVTFLIVLTASCLAELLSHAGQEKLRPQQVLVTLLPAITLLTVTVLYGEQARETEDALAARSGDSLRVALIQGNTLADWKSDAGKQEAIMREYVEVSLDAVHAAEKDGRKVDLVVWPETSFRQSLIQAVSGYTPPTERIHPSVLLAAESDLKELTHETDSAALVGIDRIEVYGDAQGELAHHTFNSSALVDVGGQLQATYDKMHLVVFGEFIPFARRFPFLYNLTPLTGGAEAGTSPTAMHVGNFTFAPNICYESAVPHLIRRQLVELSAKGDNVDAFVNLTNDAWYWGSSELDMHLACAVFRAIETHTPWLIAANGGLSAYVLADGEIARQSTRQKPEFLLVDLPKKPGESGPTAYTRLGDWFAIACMVCCVVLAGVGFAKRKT